MTRPVTLLDKTETIAGLFDSWDILDAVMAGLSEQQWQADTALPGWNVQAVVAHVIGTESFLQGVAPPEPDCDVSQLPHVNNQIAAMNECWVRSMRAESPQAMLDRFRSITADRRTVLTGMDDEAWNQTMPTPAGPDTYGRFMRVRTFDCWLHAQDIREAVGQDIYDGVTVSPAAQRAFDEITTSVPYIVGKLGGAPEGSRVALELTGPLGRTIRVAVDGRATLVQDFGGEEPSSTIRLDAMLFTRLAGGRATTDDHIDKIEFSGDTEVGERIARNLNFVI